MKLREFCLEDAPIILSWIQNKTEFRRWSADRYPEYPATPQQMAQQYEPENIHPLTAIDEEERVIGHIMIRIPSPKQPQYVRLGFIIVDNSIRGKGFGKQLLQETVTYAQQHFQAKRISLGVFLNNPAAMNCYESVGFQIIGQESYPIDGKMWEGVEMELLLTHNK